MEENKDMQLDEADIMIVIDAKSYCTLGGVGKMYDEFLRSKQIGNFTGKHTQATTREDPRYKSSLLRIVKFDGCFFKIHTTPKDCKFVFNITNNLCSRLTFISKINAHFRNLQSDNIPAEN